MLGKYCILIHYHELGLKKNNRLYFNRNNNTILNSKYIILHVVALLYL